MNHSEYPSVTARTAKESLFRCGRGDVAAAAGWLTQPFWPCRIESPTGMNLEPSAEANEEKESKLMSLGDPLFTSCSGPESIPIG